MIRAFDTIYLVSLDLHRECKVHYHRSAGQMHPL